MAVPKIAVIALVAVIAVPILLGYALNLTEVTETGYVMSDDDLNVTSLLRDGYEYSYAAADPVKLNTSFTQSQVPIIPYYSFSTTKSPVPSHTAIFTNRMTTNTHPLADYNYYYCESNYNPSYSNWLSLIVTYENDTTAEITMVHAVRYDSENSGVIKVSKFMNSGGNWIPSPLMVVNNVKALSYSVSSTFTGETLLSNSPISGTSDYADLAAGYRLNTFSTNSSYINEGTALSLPNWTNNFMFTMDLNTIAASSYTVYFATGDVYDPYDFKFTKSTISGTVHWNVSVSYNHGAYTDLTELYYDQSKSSNTYQITTTMTGIKFDYVGSWPTLFGKANTYWDYSYDFPNEVGTYLDFKFYGAETPILRIDNGTFRAFSYQIIENETYAPGQFRSNPATTFNNPTIYGDSITFGGNTYAVSDGKITIGSHQIPVKGLVLNSVPVEGGYENRIGNTVISTTATPSTITFNGKWSVDITTASQTQTTYTKTEWNVGSFAWDGIDSNFLIVGLVTCLGVFVALGIYARKSRSGGIIPLMVAVGCAAAVFFIML